jgi:hypothetical protein
MKQGGQLRSHQIVESVPMAPKNLFDHENFFSVGAIVVFEDHEPLLTP